MGIDSERRSCYYLNMKTTRTTNLKAELKSIQALQYNCAQMASRTWSGSRARSKLAAQMGRLEERFERVCRELNMIVEL